LPDVVGWDWHQRQQRAAISTEFITHRGHETAQFFTGQSADQALAFIQKYHVTYIVVGPLERVLYAASGGLEKFHAMAAQSLLDVVYRNSGVVIYRVSDPAAPAIRGITEGVLSALQCPNRSSRK